MRNDESAPSAASSVTGPSSGPPRQLAQLLREYIEHYNTHRPHRSLGQRAPNDTEVVEYRPGQPIRQHQTCNGLINEYRQAA